MVFYKWEKPTLTLTGIDICLLISFSLLQLRFAMWSIKELVRTPKKKINPSRSTDRAFSQWRSIEVGCNDCERYSGAPLVSFFFARTKPRKRYSLLTETEKARTRLVTITRESHALSFLTGKTRGIAGKTATCTIFFLPERAETRRDAKKDEGKVYSGDGFPQGSRRWLFFSRSARDPRSWSLKICSVASLSQNQIFKDKAVPANSWSHVSRTEPRYRFEVLVKSNWRRNVTQFS